MFYFVLTIVYFSNYAVIGIEEDERYALSPELVMRVSIYILILYFSFFEFVCMLREGMGYFEDVFNYMDIASYGINVFLLIKTVFRNRDLDY